MEVGLPIPTATCSVHLTYMAHLSELRTLDGLAWMGGPLIVTFEAGSIISSFLFSATTYC
jgi:hypothetical protein